MSDETGPALTPDSARSPGSPSPDSSGSPGSPDSSGIPSSPMPRSKSLKDRALRASAFTVGGHLAGHVLRVFSNVVVSRLLFPEAFGVVAIVRMVNIGLQMISDVGIRSAIIRSERGEEASFLDTAWTLQVLRGALLMGAGVAVAYPVAAFYETPWLVPLIVFSTLSPLLAGLQSTRLDLLRRRMETGRLAAIEFSAMVIATLLTIVCAYMFRSAWALVVGAVVLSAARTALSFSPASGSHRKHSRFGWDPAAAREIVHFGKWIILSTLITFFAMRLDVISLGKLVTLETLGIYSIALTIAGVPLSLMGQITGMVLLPALSESHRAGRETLARNFQTALGVLYPAALALVITTATAAPAFFSILYEERYHDASWMVQLSMMSLWFLLIQQVLSRAMLALGDSRGLAEANAIRLVVGAAAVAAGFALAGLPGLVLGMGVGSMAAQVATTVRLKRDHGLASAGITVRYSLAGTVVGLLACLGPHWVAHYTGVDQVPLFTLLAGAATAGPLACWLLLGLRRRGQQPLAVTATSS